MLFRSLFFDLMSNTNVISMIPQAVLNKEESDSQLKELIHLEKSSDTKIWSLCQKSTNEFIGFAGFLKNIDSEDEIAYRLRENYWNKGFGTEIAKGLIDFGFTTMNSNLITADVFIENVRSIKILEKFFTAQKHQRNS